VVARLILLAFLAGCTTAPVGNFCDIEHPIRHTQKVIDAETDAEVQADLAHNLKGAKLCGWTP